VTASRFRWVVGVAGNHDDVTQVRTLPNAEMLDVSVVERDGPHQVQPRR
jgi:hypothetical protein